MPARAIFVVEDDADFREMLGEYLGSLGYAVQAFASGEEALAHLRRASAPAPDLVVSDLNMPRLSGLQLMRELRATLPDVPVILMTAFGNPQVAEQAAREGAAAYLEKPFRLPELRDLVRRILG